MAKTAHTVSTEGFSSENHVRDFELTIDATGESGPDTLEVLIADYASCYVPALRVASEQRGADDLGEVAIDVTGELNDDDKLESIHFDVEVDADLDDDTATAIVERANELCKVHDALKESLYAEVDL
ncbi:OsmC family protein [Salinarchaeum sp. Harcht-Bsk1]|uniref:OsmC family protein n=1 Tax=Salinarchaeum sp. Harcht-Bsk1 TaxID=1333523 RepID=UPI0003423F7D|nr:OsmC family protein [Salinarchaeum sp. Harcht-Bsk1]AGN00103.1 OsmC family protein [Salinarchaeum sp. Harcht-Bsk1]